MDIKAKGYWSKFNEVTSLVPGYQVVQHPLQLNTNTFEVKHEVNKRRHVKSNYMTIII